MKDGTVSQCINWQLGWIEKLKPSHQINWEEESKRTVYVTGNALGRLRLLPSSFWLITELVAIITRLLSKDRRLQLYVRVHFKRRNVLPNIKAVNCMWQWIRAIFFKQWNWNVIESEWSMKKELTCKTLQEESCVMTMLKMHHL